MQSRIGRLPGVVVDDGTVWFDDRLVHGVALWVDDCDPCELTALRGVAHLTVEGEHPEVAVLGVCGGRKTDLSTGGTKRQTLQTSGRTKRTATTFQSTK